MRGGHIPRWSSTLCVPLSTTAAAVVASLALSTASAQVRARRQDGLRRAPGRNDRTIRWLCDADLSRDEYRGRSGSPRRHQLSECDRHHPRRPDRVPIGFETSTCRSTFTPAAAGSKFCNVEAIYNGDSVHASCSGQTKLTVKPPHRDHHRARRHRKHNATWIRPGSIPHRACGRCWGSRVARRRSTMRRDRKM